MPIQVKKIVYLNSNGLLNRMEDGGITNIGGTDRTAFTVGGRPVLLDYSGTGGGPVIGNVVGHVHFQYAMSTVWTIQHNKNSWHPVITTWNSQLLEIIPMQVHTVNENLIRIFFSNPISGKAVISFTDETSKTLDGTEITPPSPPQPPNPVFVNTINGMWGDVTLAAGGSSNYSQTFVRGTDFTGPAITVTHGLGKRFNIVQVYDTVSGAMIIPDEIVATTTNVCTLSINNAQYGTLNSFTVVISPGVI